MWGSDWGSRWWIALSALLSPIDEFSVLYYLFLALQPSCHLGVFVLVVRRVVGIFGHVNVQVFGLLGVVIVRRPEQLD